MRARCEKARWPAATFSALPDHASTKKDLIRTADSALYKGTTSGKNKVVIVL